MKELLKIAFKHHRNLLFWVLVSILFVTVSSQLEVFALGVLTSKHAAGTGKVQQLLNVINEAIPITQDTVTLAFFLVSVALFRAISLFAHRFLTRIVAIEVSKNLRQHYFDHLQNLPIRFFYSHNVGSLSSRVLGDSSLIAEAVNSCLTNYIQTPFIIITSLVFCFYTSWQLSLLIFLGFPAILFPIIAITKKVRGISRQIQQNKERFTSDLLDFLSGIQTIKMFSGENFSRKKYVEQNEKMALLERKSAKYDLASRPVVHTIGMSFLSVSLLWGLYGLQMSIPDAFFFCGLLYVFYEPVKKFAEENSHIQRGLAAADRLFEVLNTPAPKESSKDAIPFEHFTGSIEFNSVSFRYEDRWVLQDLNFTIQKGEMVAIVGPTGAGKSTIVHLLARLWDAETGEIRINHTPINKFTSKSLREAIAFVPQKPFLFYDTVFENITFGKDYSIDDVKEAAKKAHADEFINQLEKGYYTLLAEGGKSLSGGQQQRLAIARALVRKSPILVLDEATSSLDAVSESLIQQAIEKLRGEVTQIIIAHRLTTIQHADKILFVDEGRSIAFGTMDEVLQHCPAFQRMWGHFQNA